MGPAGYQKNIYTAKIRFHRVATLKYKCCGCSHTATLLIPLMSYDVIHQYATKAVSNKTLTQDDKINDILVFSKQRLHKYYNTSLKILAT